MEFKVKFSDCDSYKVVHNSNYIAWFEDDLYHELCGSEEGDIEIEILNIRCRYLQSAKYNQHLVISTDIEKISENRYSFKQILIDKETKKRLCFSGGEYIIHTRA